MTTRAALLWIILALGAICTSAPVIAQTYDPNYPVCLQIYSSSGVTSTAGTPRLPSAMSRPQAGARDATPIHITYHVGGRRGGTDFNLNEKHRRRGAGAGIKRSGV